MTDPSPNPSPSVRPVEYKGEPLDAERGPGLGCFWFQVALLAVLVVLTPLSVTWNWPDWASALLMISVIVLLLFAGQTIIFLLRLVAADRRAAGRRRPLASGTRTVGELEDEARQAASAGSPEGQPDASRVEPPAGRASGVPTSPATSPERDDGPDVEGPVRQ